MCVRVCTYTYIMHVCICNVCMYVCMYACMYVSTCKYVHTYVCTYVRMYVRTYVCMYVFMYMYMYLWLSRRIHYAISSCLVQEVEVIKCNISTIFRTSLSYNRSNEYRATVHSTGITSVKCIKHAIQPIV